MGSNGSETDTIVTQISVGGFDNYITAKMLLKYFEDNIGVVHRCRLKTFSTPPDSYPDFNINTANIQTTNTYEKVESHAFVHFASPDSARSALNAAGNGELILLRTPLKVSLGPEHPHRMNQMRKTKASFKLSDVRVEIGTWVSEDKFFVAWTGPPTGVDFLVDPFDGTCKFLFTKDIAFSFKYTRNHALIKCNFKVEFLVRDIKEIKHSDTPHLIILLQLESSPMIYYRTADDDIEESVSFDLLDDDDPWIRTTDFTPCGAIGRCSTYRILIPLRHRHGIKLKKAMQYLTEQRVSSGNLTKQLQIQNEPDFGTPTSDPFFCIQFKEGINFKILFLVNVVMHKGIFNQYQLSEEFFNLLRTQPEEVNVAALKHIYSSKQSDFNAYERMRRVQGWLMEDPKLLERTTELDDIVEVRRLVITPTKAYCLPPAVELSNRVLRNYRSVADQFLRVTFMDEGMQTLNKNAVTYYPAHIVRDITSHFNARRTTIFRRVKNILSEGFYLCGRKYSFLAFSANQLRDQSAWFFAEGKNTSVSDILEWMGHFTNKNVAKCAARMGQCFSSTYGTVEVPHSEVDSELPDIKRNGYVFSDGIGMISHDLAMEVAERLQLKVNLPCAYQIRYAGCKGVVACWPARKDGIRLSLRPSMNKFVSEHTILDICSWTRFQPGFLNRQIITLLLALNVRDDIFWEMQESMVNKLNRMLVNADIAFDVLTASCDEEGNTATVMLRAGFKPQTEPYLHGMLMSIRAAQFRDLREKTRIFVPSGRWLMGCLDELGILEQGQCFIQVSNPSVENCFAKHGSNFTETKNDMEVIQGYVVVAKNPCLHPGDVRILEAVDVPSLHHLFDCLVFPQKGDRPHTNEASGSDLDGDIYFVTWDEKLIPPSKRSWLPMDYAPPEVKELPRGVQHKDIIDFFVKNMVNENLGTICNAHVVHADISEYGALDEKCIKLAELAATAVDFPKTGKIVNMPFELKPKLYPDFMGKEEFQSYKSNKILGRLYRQIKDDRYVDVTASSEIKFVPKEIPYDTDLEVPGSRTFVDDAWALKCSYDQQLNGLLGQYKVNSEEEVVTGHIWSMPKYSSKKQGEIKERLKNAYNALKKEFRKVFERMDKKLEELTEDEKNTMFERRASAWYQVTYHPEWVKKARELQDPDGGTNTVMLSFPWIAVDYLARIKIKHGEMKDAQSKIKHGEMKDAQSAKRINPLARLMPNEELIHPGPIDTSLLTHQSTHRSEAIWRGQDLPPLHCKSDGGYWGLWRNSWPDRDIINGLVQAGFYGLFRLGQIRLDQTLITALVERWRKETHTFHLPVGEATVTLQDVEILVGLSTIGSPVTHDNVWRTPEMWCDEVHRILGKRPLPGKDHDVYYNALRTRWLLENFATFNRDELEPDELQRQLDFHIRAHIFMLIGSFFCDTYQNRIKLPFLLLLEDLPKVPTYSWGSACLAYLYQQLCRGSDFRSCDIAGALVLLQIWAWERFPNLALGRVPDPDDMTVDQAAAPRNNSDILLPRRPWGARWDVGFQQKDVDMNVLRVHRYVLDTMADDGFIWQPYTTDVERLLPPYCLIGRGLWRVRCPLICFEVVEWHYPDRVLRQFGIRQHIPSQLPEPSDSLHAMSRMRDRVDWSTEYMVYIQLWTDRKSLIVVGEETPDWVECTVSYMTWYRSVTRRYIFNPIHRPSDGFTGTHRQAGHLEETLSRVYHMVHRASELSMEEKVKKTLQDALHACTRAGTILPHNSVSRRGRGRGRVVPQNTQDFRAVGHRQARVALKAYEKPVGPSAETQEHPLPHTPNTQEVPVSLGLDTQEQPSLRVPETEDQPYILTLLGGEDIFMDDGSHPYMDDGPGFMDVSWLD